MELEMLLAQQLADHVLVEVGQVDDADLRKHVRHLVDDVLRAGLADGELVFVGLGGVDHLHERLHGEHVMLRGHGAQLFAGFRVLVPFLQQRRLIEDLTRVGEEFRAVHGQRDALGGTGEDLDTELVLKLLHRGAQRGLGYVQLVRGLVHGAAFHYFDDVFQLKEGHNAHLYQRRFTKRRFIALRFA